MKKEKKAGSKESLCVLLCTCSRRTLNDIRERIATRAVRAPPWLLFGLYLGFLELDFPEIAKPFVNLWNVKTAYQITAFPRSSQSHMLVTYCLPVGLIQLYFCFGGEYRIHVIVFICP